jgi:hypothetical protein
VLLKKPTAGRAQFFNNSNSSLEVASRPALAEVGQASPSGDIVLHRDEMK